MGQTCEFKAQEIRLTHSWRNHVGKFELFKNRAVRQVKGPAGTVQARGAFTLNSAALEHLGNPEAVHLYFDNEDKRVGIERAEPGSPYAYTTRPAGKGVSRLISAKSFMDTYGVPYEKTVPVRVSYEGDMVVLDVAPLISGQHDGSA